jgi:hypothetical protein
MQPQIAQEAAQAVQSVAPQVSLFGIRLEGWLTILALILGPIIALGLQRDSERRRERKARKMTIFKELMATRAAKLSPRHVEALNAIEIEFSSGRGTDKQVAAAWRLYLDHLSDQTVNANDAAAVARWGEKANDLLIDLLFEMSNALKYDFDKVSLKKGIYSPRAHGELETDQFMLRKFLLELMEGKRAMWTGVFTGERPLQMQVFPPAPPQPQQPAARAILPPEQPPPGAPGEPQAGG